MLTTEVIQTLAHSLDYEIPNTISPHQLMALNILLEQFTSNRQERLALASRLLGTAVLTTKTLTFGQASAILQTAYPLPVPIQQQEVDVDFCDLISDLNMEKSHDGV